MIIKKSAILFLFCLFSMSVNVLIAQGEPQITIESLLNEIVDRDALARFPKSDFRLKQQSSYNRASKTPKDTVGWFTNKDFNSDETDHNFIRTEEKNGEKEWVLMEHFGPEAIVRIWPPFLSPDKPDSDVEVRINLAENPNEYLPEHKKSGEMETDLAENPKYADKLAEMEALLLEQMIANNDPYRLWDQTDEKE